MKINTAVRRTFRTHEGAPAWPNMTTEQALRRSVMSCLLWESEFYEDGQTIADRIVNLVPKVAPEKVAAIAIDARSKMHLRHVPLLICAAMLDSAKHKGFVRETLAQCIQRADELAEFLAIYWRNGRKRVPCAALKGLAQAFTKFDAYSLAKYNRDGAVKLRDVLRLCHAKPKDGEQSQLWKRLLDDKLDPPDTWEVRLSRGDDKLTAWNELIAEQKLGGLAVLRNLRNMQEAGVNDATIRKALTELKAERVLPFRFIAAARYAPQFEPELEAAMFKNLEGAQRLGGRTVLLVDVSSSMDQVISAKSDLRRVDAACALAVLLREVCADIRIITFSNQGVEVPPRRGFALRDAIMNSQQHAGTYLGQAVTHALMLPHDRLIVISDEQSHDPVPPPTAKAYMLNVASAQNGVGYGKWIHVDGWSESVIRFIWELEQAD